MGMFDGLLNSVLQGLGGKDGDPSSLGQTLNNALAKTEFGSLQGVLDHLQTSGLGAQVASWLGNGSNLPIDVEQIRGALGNAELQKLATQFGIPLDQISGMLAQYLPDAVDKLSPNGKLTT
ncbi:hypothetical protein C3941_01885 [Kaistia algarum]|uniref:YidB family protein n=1 Tax=Kaistia algarum TaxID=2083279 RepID=UPI000CE9250E|nr:YidB family protein [Kaistia algarum]MCX5513029.1 YidB family protein [Kaistia algarum]PPE81489.1 hypothetical protein C3941_01885 [Kaistia algarum]